MQKLGSDPEQKKGESTRQRRDAKETEARYHAALILAGHGLATREIASQLNVDQGQIRLLLEMAEGLGHPEDLKNPEAEEPVKKYSTLMCATRGVLRRKVDLDIETLGQNSLYHEAEKLTEIAMKTIYGNVESDLAGLKSINRNAIPEIIPIYAPAISKSEKDGLNSWYGAVEVFARGVAQHLYPRILKRYQDWESVGRDTDDEFVIMLAWGRTLIATAKALMELEPAPRDTPGDDRPLSHFFWGPGWGEPCGDIYLPAEVEGDEERVNAFMEQFALSSSSLSLQLDRHFRKSVNGSHSLRGIPGIVPSFLPRKKSKDATEDSAHQHQKNFDETVRHIPAFRRIFGNNFPDAESEEDSDAVVNNAHGAIVAIGASVNYDGAGYLSEFWAGEHLLGGHAIDSKRFRMQSIGDCGGCPMGRPGFPEDYEHGPIYQLKQRWLGLRERHLAQIAKNSQDGIGTVGLAVGADRAMSVLAAARRPEQILTTLYVDANCILELKRLIEIEKEMEIKFPQKDSTDYKELRDRTKEFFNQKWRDYYRDGDNWPSIDDELMREQLRSELYPEFNQTD